jgi:hypothetical protein
MLSAGNTVRNRDGRKFAEVHPLWASGCRRGWSWRRGCSFFIRSEIEVKIGHFAQRRLACKIAITGHVNARHLRGLGHQFREVLC